MALAVCMLFDSRTNRLLRELWDRLEGSGIGTLASHTHGRHRPHLSYAVLLEWDLERVQAAVGGLADGGPFEINVQGTLTFPRGRAALAPAIPPDVAVRQARLVEVLRGTGATVHRHYELGRWVPHVSVATRAPAPRSPWWSRRWPTSCRSRHGSRRQPSSTAPPARPGS